MSDVWAGALSWWRTQLFFFPLVWTFVPNALPQALQNLTVKLAIDGLTRRYEFLVDIALDVRKNDQHELNIATKLTRFFRPRWIWQLPLQRMLLSLRVITIKPMFHHWLWYWRWSWGCLWLVVWVPCRQKCEGPSGRRSAVLAQISQKCVSCSNCPPKCVEWSCTTVLLPHKHRG